MGTSLNSKNNPIFSLQELYSPDQEPPSSPSFIAEKLEVYFEKARHTETLLKQERAKSNELAQEIQNLKDSISKSSEEKTIAIKEHTEKAEAMKKNLEETRLDLLNTKEKLNETQANQEKKESEVNSKWMRKLKIYYKNIIYFKKISEVLKKKFSEEESKKSQIRIELEVVKSRNSFLETKIKESDDLHHYFQKKYLNLAAEMSSLKKKIGFMRKKLEDYQDFYSKNKDMSEEVALSQQRYIHCQKELDSMRYELGEEREKNHFLNNQLTQEKREKNLALSHLHSAEARLNKGKDYL